MTPTPSPPSTASPLQSILVPTPSSFHSKSSLHCRLTDGRDTHLLIDVNAIFQHADFGLCNELGVLACILARKEQDKGTTERNGEQHVDRIAAQVCDS